MKTFRFSAIFVIAIGLILAACSQGGQTSAPTPIVQVTPSDPDHNPNSPTSPVKLIFIHHSTGGMWLADKYGGLGSALMANNYYVSATNYGWGPGNIGDRTDIVNWPEWFTGDNYETIMNAVYTENGQNIGDFGKWSRLKKDPGGENQIIVFKSCFPNSDLWGSPDDPPAAVISDQWTVSNAKAIYNDLLSYFTTRQDKLFIVITAPPLGEGDYGTGDQTAAQRAANARAFNDWLVNDWLADYPYKNVAVFDYYNVLTSNASEQRTDVTSTNEEPNDASLVDGNHHRWWDGAVQYLKSVDNNFSAYPNASPGDSHPTIAGQQKATEEFVPLLNVFYNRWVASMNAGS
jgi:hypothetical protein